ncbi:unnamed protein product [Arabis nemorensis]|uniref:Uncharacterized protein n=1 Tax=Arabis nemorensis TaxID=586526 RepID=A0A565BXP5_9BRAS|nr:unnamed protein product [Arabis nemorensis]
MDPYQCQDLQTEANTKMSIVDGVCEKSDNNKGGSKSQCVFTNPEVNMKQKLSKDLASFQLLLKEFEELTLELTGPVEKSAKKQTLEDLKTIEHRFVRDVLQDSEKRNQESLVDKVKQAKRMVEQYVFDAKMEIKKAERKKMKLQVQSKKQEMQSSKKKK